MKIPGYLMIYNLKLFLLLILYQFIDDLVAWVYITIKHVVRYNRYSKNHFIKMLKPPEKKDQTD